jgi:hypothetical protein
MHALDAEKLIVSRDAMNQWKPEAGLERIEFADVAAPAATHNARLLQIRRLAREFTGFSVDRGEKKWELRLLPAPVYTYPAAKTGVVSGALFALVSNAGTDPEVLLVIEAVEEAGKMHWQYACGRFSDMDLHVHRKDKEVYTSVRSETNTFAHDPKHLYRIYPEKVVTTEGKVLARIRQTAKGPERIPVGEK